MSAADPERDQRTAMLADALAATERPPLMEVRFFQATAGIAVDFHRTPDLTARHAASLLRLAASQMETGEGRVLGSDNGQPCRCLYCYPVQP